MTRKFLFTSTTWIMAALPFLAQAQTELQPDTLLQAAAENAAAWEDAEEDDASDFTFTESQLDDDLDAAQVIASVTSSADDPYRSEVGFLWSAMRFRLRALDNMYATSYLNGLQFNDMELGRFNYSLLGGMNDATRNKEGANNTEFNTFGVVGLGGGDNTNLRASKFQQGQKMTVSLCNRNYKYRAMYSFGTGLMGNGWAFGGLVGYRGASEGVIEGTFYNSLSYLLSAEKRLGENHAISLVTFGSPTERAQQGASTEEAYWLANSHYYNPNWGYQNGEKRNARVVNDYEPTAILTWDWTIDDISSLVTNVGFKYSNYSSTALGFAGEAYDPRPDYYKNLPSSVFNVYDEDINNQDYLSENIFLVEQYNALMERWSTKAGRQIDWDRLYYINQQSDAAGGEALYYQERRHNDQRVWALSSTYNRQLADNQKIVGGIQLNSTKGMHYKTMADLLGATRYTDIDKFAAGDYGLNSMQAQNDMRHPNRLIKEGDTFGYNYEIDVLYSQLWAQYQYQLGSFNANIQANIDGTRMRRNGLMQSGQGQLLQDDGTYLDNSYGKSDWASFLGGGVKAQAQWRPWANQTLTVAAGWAKKAPLARNAFVAPRIQNDFVNNLTLEDHLSADASWQFRFGSFSGKAAAYFVDMRNQVEQTAFFNDANSAFTYLTMSNVSKQHYGLELALKYDITNSLSVHATGSWNQALYTNNPYAQLNTQGMSEDDNYTVNQWVNPVTGENEKLLVAADGMHVGSTPLTALNLGAEYSIHSWFFEVNLNWYDRVYVGFSQYRRLTNIMNNYTNNAVNLNGEPIYSVTEAEIRENGAVLWDESTGNIKRIYGAQQEKFHPGFMLDASIGKFIRLPYGKSMSINLSVQNLTNNTNLRTGGYEQNRDDNYYNSYGTGDGSRGLAKSYKFSRNSKYYYANSINAFLNVNFKW